VEKSPRKDSHTIFLIHGHNLHAREQTARFLEEVIVDCQLTILDEQANRGRLLLEKFEQIASEAAYGVALLTADDEGRPAGDEQWHARGRQNVIFEMGYFFGRLGRDRIAVLYDPGVELPSDVAGLVYIERSGERWKIELVRELRAAGLDASLDRL